MTFEEALSKVNEMTDMEKECCIPTRAVRPDDKKRYGGDYTIFTVLEFDAETEETTDKISCLMIPTATLTEIYETGDIVLFQFQMDDEDLLCQILESKKFIVPFSPAWLNQK